jgi:hypothetical protein
LVLSVIFSTCCKKQVKFEKEKAALIAAIKEEKKGYSEKNLEMIKMNVVTDSSYTFIYSDVGGNCAEYYNTN